MSKQKKQTRSSAANGSAYPIANGFQGASLVALIKAHHFSVIQANRPTFTGWHRRKGAAA